MFLFSRLQGRQIRLDSPKLYWNPHDYIFPLYYAGFR